MAFPILLVVAAVYPLVRGDQLLIRLATLIALEAILVLGLQVIFGFSGSFSFGHAGLYGVGAYTAAILMTRFEMGFPLALIAAVVAGAVMGIAMGLPAIRVRGDYLALITLAWAEILRIVMLNWKEVTGGSAGIFAIPRPSVFFVHVESNNDFYLLALGLLVICLYVVWRLRASGLGLNMLAVRDDELAARGTGVDAGIVKVTAFLIGGALAGVAGGFYATWAGYISSVSFDIVESFTLMIMLILGGRGNILGSIFGAGVIVLINEQLNQLPSVRLGITGLLMVLVVFWRSGVFNKAAVRGLATRWRTV